MTINLEDYIGKTVEVELRNGNVIGGHKIYRKSVSNSYNYAIGSYLKYFNQNGVNDNNRNYDIIKIKEIKENPTELMKPVKITAEITLTPEMFSEWNEGVLPETELEYHHFIEKVVYGKFAYGLNIGKYKDFINKTIDDNGDGLKVTVEELK